MGWVCGWVECVGVGSEGGDVGEPVRVYWEVRVCVCV